MGGVEGLSGEGYGSEGDGPEEGGPGVAATGGVGNGLPYLEDLHGLGVEGDLSGAAGGGGGAGGGERGVSGEGEVELGGVG